MVFLRFMGDIPNIKQVAGSGAKVIIDFTHRADRVSALQMPDRQHRAVAVSGSQAWRNNMGGVDDEDEQAQNPFQGYYPRLSCV